MNKNITVRIDKHYGTRHVYITSEHAEAVQTLTGNKTITYLDIQALRALGFDVTNEQAEV